MATKKKRAEVYLYDPKPVRAKERRPEAVATFFLWTDKRGRLHAADTPPDGKNKTAI